MRLKRARVLVLLLVVIAGMFQTPAQAQTFQLTVAGDKTSGYNRSAFKHWIDADKDGCDTRAEVLIEEAIVKPKIGLKCKLTGGKWLSAYDGKTVTNASQLDVDHMVPLAEAWRSGAWMWSSAKRQAFANDLEESRALIAVTLSTNRSKGDKDPALWMPSQARCSYVSSWIAVKWRYDLTVDSAEANTLKTLVTECGFTNVVIGESVVVPSSSPTPTPTPTMSATPTTAPTVTPTPVITPSITPTPTPTPTVSNSPVTTPTPTPVATTSSLIVTPGAFCSPAGATGKSTSGVSYTCRTSPTDTRNRWRQ